MPLAVMSIVLEGSARDLHALNTFDLTDAAALTFNVAVATMLGFGGWYWLLDRYPAGTIAPLALMVPASGMTSAWILLGEKPAPAQIAGAAIAVCGVAVVVFGASSRPKPVAGSDRWPPRPRSAPHGPADPERSTGQPSGGDQSAGLSRSHSGAGRTLIGACARCIVVVVDGAAAQGVRLLFPAAVVDAFTDRPFSGNPAGLVLLSAFGEREDDAWMQSVAREVGVSETGFLVRNRAGTYRLRWFTPAVEMDLCGHATLAAAHWLWERGEASEVLLFDTRSGRLSAFRDEATNLIWLDLPTVPVIDRQEPVGWQKALGAANLEWVGRTDGLRELERNALVVTDAATLRGLRPDFELMKDLPCGGVIVTARSDSTDSDVFTRYFAPACGVNEDPVTGSAHCTVGWYWSPLLGTRDLRARQLSERGGHLRVLDEQDRVRLGGHAVTVATLDFLA